MFIFPFLSALANAGSVVIDKFTFKKYKIPVEVFIPVLFLLVFILTSLFVPFLGRVSLKILEPFYLFVFAGMVMAAVIQNIFYYRAIQAEKVAEFELFNMTVPLVTVLLAAIIFPAERNWYVFLAALAASLTLIFTHLKKTSIVFSRGSLFALIAVLFIAIEIQFQKIILEVISPVSLYAIRCGFLALIFIVMHRQAFAKNALLAWKYLLIPSILAVLTMVFRFYGFETVGIIYTVLVLTISPLLIYLASALLFKEKVALRVYVGAIIILGAIIIGTLAEF
jgi:drug/metabolite transporter (DMT)-like permease